MLAVGITGGCDSGLQEPGEREPPTELDNGSQSFEISDVPDTRTIPFLCDSNEICDDNDPCTNGRCNGRFCEYTTLNVRLAVQIVETTAPALDVALGSGRLYVAEGEFGLEVFDTSDLNAVGKVGNAQTVGIAIDVEAHDNGVIVAEGEDGIETFSANADPVQHYRADSGLLNDVDRVESVDIGPAYAIVSGYSDGVVVGDFSSLDGASRTRLINTGGRAMAAASTSVLGTVADALGGTGVVLFDENDGPIAGIALPTSGRVLDVDIRTDTVIMAEYGAGWGIGDLSDPALPVRLVDYPTPEFIVGAGLLGTQTAAVLEWRETEGRGRIELWNISKNFTRGFKDGEPVARPLNPQSIVSAWIDGKPEGMDIRGGLLAVASDAGVSLFWTGCAE